jgi:IS605 OrfB family transposase
MCYALRKDGYKNLSECIRLVECLDACASMTTSYQRIHLMANQQLQQIKKFDMSRANFRDFITRKIAYALVKKATDCNIVFVEDLNFAFNKDNDNNSLLRLFTPATLLKYIKEGLEKIGVEVVEVNKAGTSKSDPITGNLGWRNDQNSSQLFVERNGKIGFIDCDPAASLNILLNGLNHSVCPYKVFIKKKSDNKQRISRFWLEKFKNTKIKLFKNAKEHIDTKGKLIDNEYIYYHAGKIMTEKQHYQLENKIKDYAKGLIKDQSVGLSEIKKFDITDCGTMGYRNFTV